jgi:hypothetical protein
MARRNWQEACERARLLLGQFYGTAKEQFAESPPERERLARAPYILVDYCLTWPQPAGRKLRESPLGFAAVFSVGFSAGGLSSAAVA